VVVFVLILAGTIFLLCWRRRRRIRNSTAMHDTMRDLEHGGVHVTERDVKPAASMEEPWIIADGKESWIVATPPQVTTVYQARMDGRPFSPASWSDGDATVRSVVTPPSAISAAINDPSKGPETNSSVYYTVRTRLNGQHPPLGDNAITITNVPGLDPHEVMVRMPSPPTSPTDQDDETAHRTSLPIPPPRIYALSREEYADRRERREILSLLSAPSIVVSGDEWASQPRQSTLSEESATLPSIDVQSQQQQQQQLIPEHGSASSGGTFGQSRLDDIEEQELPPAPVVRIHPNGSVDSNLRRAYF